MVPGEEGKARGAKHKAEPGQRVGFVVQPLVGQAVHPVLSVQAGRPPPARLFIAQQV